MIRTVAMVCVAAFLAVMTGCVSMDQYDATKLALGESQERLANADKDLQKARDQMEVMKKQIAELNDLLGKSDTGVAALKADRDKWQAHALPRNATDPLTIGITWNS